jgi:post-segregation antitoxin (ccd killing protein)
MTEDKIVISVNVNREAIEYLRKRGFNISALVNEILEKKAKELKGES